LLLVAGCQNRPSQLDPFLGKTTVPPPATGAVGAQAPGVLAYPAAPPTMTAPPAAVSPGTAAPVTVPPPPGTFNPPASTPIPQPLSGTTTPPPNNPPPSSPPSTMNVSTPIRVVPPDPNRRITSGSAPSGGVDIMDLPVRGSTTQPKTAGGAGGGALQSYTAPPGSTFNVDSAAAKTLTIPGQNFAYANDAAYTQLSGRLEYSSIDGRWLLRYTAPESRADRYGGVAILIGPNQMNGFRNGDFVTAAGRLEANGSASPVFTAGTVTLQRETR
jgi:hypothetical protein